MSHQQIAQELASIERSSVKAFDAIVQSGRRPSEADRVCWHGRSLIPVSDEEGDEFYDLIERTLPECLPPMDLECISFGAFELWEHAFPTTSWLAERLDQFQAFGERTGSCPEGWSYEPTDRSKGFIPQAWADDKESAN